MWPKKYIHIHVYFYIEEHLSHLATLSFSFKLWNAWLRFCEALAPVYGAEGRDCPALSLENLLLCSRLAEPQWTQQSGESSSEEACLGMTSGSCAESQRGASWDCPHPQSEALSLGAGCHVHWYGHSAAVSLLFSWQRSQYSVTAFQMTGSF